MSNKQEVAGKSVPPPQPLQAPANLQGEQVTRLKKLYELSMLLSGDPMEIFAHVARMIGELLEVKVVCLSEIRGQDLEFLSVYVDGEIYLNAGACPLDITPCATVEHAKDIRIYDRVIERFPQATFLKDHDAFSYCGFPAIGNDGSVVAVTCLLDDKPHDFSEEDLDILRIFGQRIGMELERQKHINAREQAEADLRKHQNDLEMLVQEKTVSMAEAMKEAEHANNAKSDFLSQMSHELRTPMNAILGFGQVLEVENLLPHQIDYVHEILSAGDHLLDLVNELLDLSRIEAGKMAIILEAVNLQSIITDAVQLTHQLIHEKHIDLTIKCDTPATVLADPTRLKQILVNLLSNAAKYNRQGGRIIINCLSQDGEHQRLSVTDSGLGIPLDKQSLLFKPFERLGADYTTVEGTGIGLTVSKKLAELMGGTLGFSSIPDEGSTFWVDLPSAPEISNAQIPESSAIQSSGNSQRLKVLCIEDNSANMKVVEAMFQNQPKLAFIPARNGENGIELARRYQPDAILLDIHLPDMDGYAVLKALRSDSTTSHIPVIALSADAMPIEIENGLAAGFNDYLTKPVNMKLLLDTIDHYVSAHTRDQIPLGG